MKYKGYILVFFILIIANGFWGLSKAPEHYASCQTIEWAQEHKENEFRPDKALALSIIKIVKCDLLSSAEKNMDKNHVATWYVCWHLANESGYKDDSDLFEKMISMIRKLPSIKAEQHYEFIGYAEKRVLEMDIEVRNWLYENNCSEGLRNIESALDSGMLN